MRTLLLLLSTTLAAPALAQVDPGTTQTVIITGTPLHESEKALADCLARKCSPKEDIKASLAHAENQFISGAYEAGHHTLRAASKRNKRFAATLPVEVSDLLRAEGRMANLDGRVDLGRFAQIESLEALQAGLKDEDSRVLMQRLMIGDEFAREGRLQAAERVYGKVAKQARAAGLWRVAGYAMLHDAVVHGAVASVIPEYRYTANRKIKDIEKSKEPQLAEHRAAAKLLRAQLAAYANDSAALEKAIVAIPPQSSEKPILVFAPPVVSHQTEIQAAMVTSGASGAPEWMDVRFRIGADGVVRHVETIRGSENLSDWWMEQVAKAVSKRRYAPLALPASSEGVTRVERFSYIYDEAYRTGSRIAGRTSIGRTTSLDITADPSRS